MLLGLELEAKIFELELEPEPSSSSGSDLYKSKQFLDILNSFLFPRIPFYLINSVKAAKGQTIKRL